MNDFYARDTSKKVSAVYRAKGNKGEHTGNHPIYGYLKDPENKQRWIIDEEAAAVVRRIFRMVIDGKGVYQIADILSEERYSARLPTLPQRVSATAGTTSLKIPIAGGVRR